MSQTREPEIPVISARMQDKFPLATEYKTFSRKTERLGKDKHKVKHIPKVLIDTDSTLWEPGQYKIYSANQLKNLLLSCEPNERFDYNSPQKTIIRIRFVLEGNVITFAQDGAPNPTKGTPPHIEMARTDYCHSAGTISFLPLIEGDNSNPSTFELIRMDHKSGGFLPNFNSLQFAFCKLIPTLQTQNIKLQNVVVREQHLNSGSTLAYYSFTNQNILEFINERSEHYQKFFNDTAADLPEMKPECLITINDSPPRRPTSPEPMALFAPALAVQTPAPIKKFASSRYLFSSNFANLTSAPAPSPFAIPLSKPITLPVDNTTNNPPKFKRSLFGTSLFTQAGSTPEDGSPPNKKPMTSGFSLT
jgi:hypothetical protein